VIQKAVEEVIKAQT